MKTKYRFKFVTGESNELPVVFCNTDDVSILAVDVNDAVERADVITMNDQDPMKVTLYQDENSLLVRPHVTTFDGVTEQFLGFQKVNDTIEPTDSVFFTWDNSNGQLNVSNGPDLMKLVIWRNNACVDASDRLSLVMVSSDTDHESITNGRLVAMEEPEEPEEEKQEEVSKGWPAGSIVATVLGIVIGIVGFVFGIGVTFFEWGPVGPKQAGNVEMQPLS